MDVDELWLRDVRVESVEKIRAVRLRKAADARGGIDISEDTACTEEQMLAAGTGMGLHQRHGAEQGFVPRIGLVEVAVEIVDLEREVNRPSFDPFGQRGRQRVIGFAQIGYGGLAALLRHLDAMQCRRGRRGGVGPAVLVPPHFVIAELPLIPAPFGNVGDQPEALEPVNIDRFVITGRVGRIGFAKGADETDIVNRAQHRRSDNQHLPIMVDVHQRVPRRFIQGRDRIQTDHLGAETRGKRGRVERRHIILSIARPGRSRLCRLLSM
jgi:hypothetical protein